MYPLNHQWEYLDLKNCWASSRYEYGYYLTFYFYTFRFSWWPLGFQITKHSYEWFRLDYTSYPCSTHTTNWMWWFWLSEKVPTDHQMKEITYRLEFDTVKRLRYIAVLFMTAPKDVRLESTQDGENW